MKSVITILAFASFAVITTRAEILVNLDPSTALYDSEVLGLVNDVDLENKVSGIPALEDAQHARGWTFHIDYTPTAADLTGLVLLIEIGGASNGTGLYLINGVPTVVSKQGSTGITFPTATHQPTLPVLSVQSRSGPLQAGVSYSFSASWDHSQTLELIVKPDGAAPVDDSFIIAGALGNWSGNDTLSVKDKPTANSTGGLSTESGNPYSIAGLKNFAGTVSRALFWNALSLTTDGPPPASFTRIITLNGRVRTVHFAHHPVRNPNYNVRIQDATGTFNLHTPGPPRTYIGTVENEPGSIAAGLLRSNGDFRAHIVAANATSWNVTGGAVTAVGSANWTPDWPTGDLPGPGGAGRSVRVAEVGIDTAYSHFRSTGSSIENTVELAEFSIMKVNLAYLRDAGILHRIGRFLIRGSASQCPYDAIGNDTGDLLPAFRNQWTNVLRASPHFLATTQDLALLAKPNLGAGLAYTATIATSAAYSVNSSSGGDFSSFWRHEAGHNWGSSHYEGGGRPEGPTIMSDNSLSRFSSSELAKILAHRNSKLSKLTNLGPYPFPLPPRANQDRASLGALSASAVLDVLENDSDSNGEALQLQAPILRSARGGLISRLPADATHPRQRVTYYSPPRFISGGPEVFDHFDYVIEDSSGATGSSKVYVRPITLPPHPVGWSRVDVGSSPVPGDSGAAANESRILYSTGAGVGGTSDAFHFVARDFTDDGSITARVLAFDNVKTPTTAGLILRDGTSASAPFAFVGVTPANRCVFRYRTSNGLAAVEIADPSLTSPASNWLRLSRTGDLISAWSSADGSSWALIGSASLALPSTFSAGLAVSGNANSSLHGAAAFDGIAVDDGNPPATGLVETFDIGSPPTIGNDLGDPLDTQWFAFNANLALYLDAAMATNRTLDVAPTAGNASARATFKSLPLENPGDSIALTFTFRYTQRPANDPDGFRFGFFSANGDGYSVRQGTGGSTSYTLVRDASGTHGFGTAETSTLAATTKATIAETIKRTVSLRIVRTTTGITITATIDGVILEAEDSSPLPGAFDTLAILNGNIVTQPFRIDNVIVDVTPTTQPVLLSSQPETFETWRQAQFGSARSIKSNGENDDPDADGLVNLVEYALGLNPHQPDPPPDFQLVGNRAILTAPVNPDATDVVIKGQWSDNLKDWHDTTLISSSTPDVPTLSIEHVSASPASQLFLRLKVTRTLINDLLSGKR